MPIVFERENYNPRNASKLVFANGGLTITNLNDDTDGKVSIRYQKTGDNYYPIISGSDGDHGYSMNQNALIYMIGTLIKTSIGISGEKGYVNTEDLIINESIRVRGQYGLTGRAEFSDGSYMQYVCGSLVGGYTTEGGEIK